MTPAASPVPPIPELSVVVSDPLEAASPARPAGGSPARNESLLSQISPPKALQIAKNIHLFYILAHISRTGFQLFSLVVHMSPL